MSVTDQIYLERGSRINIKKEPETISCGEGEHIDIKITDFSNMMTSDIMSADYDSDKNKCDPERYDKIVRDRCHKKQSCTVEGTGCDKPDISVGYRCVKTYGKIDNNEDMLIDNIKMIEKSVLNKPDDSVNVYRVINKKNNKLPEITKLVEVRDATLIIISCFTLLAVITALLLYYFRPKKKYLISV